MPCFYASSNTAISRRKSIGVPNAFSRTSSTTASGPAFARRARARRAGASSHSEEERVVLAPDAEQEHLDGSLPPR